MAKESIRSEAHHLPLRCETSNPGAESLMSLIDIVQQHIGPSEIQQISQQLGVDSPTAQRAVQSAIPSLIAGMAGHAQEPGGASTIESSLGAHANVLGSLGGLLGAAAPGDNGILGSILGRHQDTVSQNVQQTSGLDSAKTQQLLSILAPIVLGALANHRAQSPQPAGNLGDVLEHEAQQVAQQSPRADGLIGKILSQVETPRQ